MVAELAHIGDPAAPVAVAAKPEPAPLPLSSFWFCRPSWPPLAQQVRNPLLSLLERMNRIFSPNCRPSPTRAGQKKTRVQHNKSSQLIGEEEVLDDPHPVSQALPDLLFESIGAWSSREKQQPCRYLDPGVRKMFYRSLNRWRQFLKNINSLSLLTRT